MITPDHVQLMARYNRWQNGSIYAAADTLTEAQRREARGAFWGSIHLTLWHILWSDQNWMRRFTGRPSPWFEYGGQAWPKTPKESVGMEITWQELRRQRAAFDEIVMAWAGDVKADWLAETCTYTHGTGRVFSLPYWTLVTHMFNHETHHRGQVHCLITQMGGKPEDTDIPWMPETA